MMTKEEVSELNSLIHRLLSAEVSSYAAEFEVRAAKNTLDQWLCNHMEAGPK